MKRHAVRSAPRSRRRVKRQIKRAVGICSRNADTLRAVVKGEETAKQDSPVRLRRDCLHLVSHGSAGIESRIERPIRVYAGNAVASRAVVGGEDTTNNNSAIGLNDKGDYGTVRARDGIKSRIERAVRVEPRNVVAARAIHDRKITAHQDSAIGLYCEGADWTCIRADKAGIKGQIKVACSRSCAMRRQN